MSWEKVRLGDVTDSCLGKANTNLILPMLMSDGEALIWIIFLKCVLRITNRSAMD